MKKYLLIVLGIIVFLAAGYFTLTEFVFKDGKKLDSVIDDIIKDEEPIVVPKLKIIDEDSNSRPIAVMINNHSKARPFHSGLNDAHIVYEMIVEGGITRLMAVFKDQKTERIGSVRSSRHNFLDYALENDAVYVHFGWSEKAKSDISTLGVNNINGLYDSGFWRDRSLGVATEHTAYTSMEKIDQMIARHKYRTTSDKENLLNYSIDEIDISTSTDALIANNISIPYSTTSRPSYTYDSVNKVYLRSFNGVKHVDYVTKEQYSFKNIIIAKIENYSFDSYGRQDLRNIGTGEGYFITNGYAVPITWTKSSRSSQTVYKNIDGTEIKVNDGSTFIQLQPINQVPIFGE